MTTKQMKVRVFRTVQQEAVFTMEVDDIFNYTVNKEKAMEQMLHLNDSDYIDREVDEETIVLEQ